MTRVAAKVQIHIRASFSQERMTYLPGEASAKTGHREAGKVEYRSKDGKKTKVFVALEWIAVMCSHVPNKGEQMHAMEFIRLWRSYYSNVARGKRKKAGVDDKIRCILKPVESLKVERSELTGQDFRRNWTRLIQNMPLYYAWVLI